MIAWNTQTGLFYTKQAGCFLEPDQDKATQLDPVEVAFLHVVFDNVSSSPDAI